MSLFRNSLAARIFLAIAGTAVLIIAIMGLLVAVSMRDGFARYLLRAELTRFDDLEQALVATHNAAAPGWPELTASSKTWNDFVRLHFEPRAGTPARTGPPPGASSPGPRVRPPPPGAPPPGRPPPGGSFAGDTLMIGERLVLLDPNGVRLAGARDPSGLRERREICADPDCAGDDLLGYLGLNAPLASVSGGDAFFLRRQYDALAVSALIAVLVSAVAAFLVARHILIPIRQLELGANKLASGDYAARIPQKSRDELGQLVGHYNALAATLERTAKAEREWISNTSHELQTPLATLRAQIEALQDGVRAPDAATLAGMHAAVMRLSRLVQDIKTLSHSREGALATAFYPDDLVEITRETVAAARPLLEAKGLRLDLDLPGAMPLACDRLRIGQVIDNLLQNALRYTSAPGRVRLSMRASDKAVRLIVEDTPPAPSKDDLARLFDRFFRAEASRSRAFGGSGLGLAVSKAIVEAHGGTISAALSDLGGLRIIVSLPKETT
ncbi:ATP-binding protein [Roseivivax sp. CAU 1753]